MTSKTPRYPLQVSPDRRRFIDADGDPFLVVGDAPWSLIVNTTMEGCTRYLDDRHARGITTVMVNLIEHLFRPTRRGPWPATNRSRRPGTSGRPTTPT